MQRINFQDGQKTSSAKVTIDNVDYPVTPARYSGATPLSATVLNTMQTNIENAIDQNADNIGGEDYDSTATYEEGDIVKHEGQLYVANQDIDEPEEWTEAHWTATDVLSSAGGNEVAIGDSSAVTSKTKIWIDTDDETDVFSEVVDSLSGNEVNKAPSVRAVKEDLNTYSTSEIVIGKWTDGKLIYRQVITGTKNHNDILVSNVSELINSYGTGVSGYNKRTLPYYEYFNNTKYAINVYQNGSDIKTEIVLGSNSSASINVTLEYTKTTDVVS